MSEYKLVGSRKEYEYVWGGYNGRYNEVDTVLATFSTREKAEKYVEDSKLKSKFGFKQKSVLFGCDHYEIVGPEDEDDIPHDPVI